MPTLSPGRVARWLRPLGYVVGWPLIAAYRRRTRRSLRWRLAGSHLTTVFVSVMAIALVGAVALVTLGLIQNPGYEEPAAEAGTVAEILTELKWGDDLWQATRAAALLRGFAAGEVSPNWASDDVNISVGIGKAFANIESISVIGPNEKVLVSSEARLFDRPVADIGPGALEVARAALAGSTDTERNSIVRPDAGVVVGAYPVEAAGATFAVVVDKTANAIPTDTGITRLALQAVGQVALAMAVLVGLPAIPVGILNGMRRGRGIGRPVTEMAATARTIADGDLNARVVVDCEDEIGDLGHSFNKMADRVQAALAEEAAARAEEHEARGRAEQLLAANRELVANVSHELRTPVALVRGHLEALASDPERAEEYARIALRETDRLERLVSDLFELARIENAAIRPERRPFDARDAVREAVESLAEPARRESGVVVQAEVGAGAVPALGDRARLVQVLQNLVRNAIRFTPEGGIVLVAARDLGEAVEVSVGDTGEGIEPADLPHVFDRFYRADRSRGRAVGGAGLGLAIVRGLVQAMGGEIGVESVVGEGTVFTIRLLRAEPDPRPAQERVAAVDPRPLVPVGS